MPCLTRDRILALIPHAGAMCLLDSVTRWDHSCIHCRSESHRRGRAHPLWHNGGIAPVHLIEYGAQAAAVHGGLLAGESGDGPPSGGFLAGLRDVALAGQPVDAMTSPLAIRAFREMGGAQGVIYRFEVVSAAVIRASGRLTIMDAT